MFKKPYFSSIYFQDFDSSNATILPDLVLQKIFAKLSYQDLSMAEQVNKQWNANAKLVWSDKTSFSCHLWYSNTNDDIVSFPERDRTPDKFIKVFSSLFESKLDGRRITRVDFTEIEPRIVSKRLVQHCLTTLAERCPNIESLRLDHFYIHEEAAAELSQLLASLGERLKLLSLRCCRAVDDDAIEAALRLCPNLCEVNMNRCRITGTKVFERSLFANLKKLKLIYCDELEDESLVPLIRMCTSLESLTVMIHDTDDFFVGATVVPCIVESLPAIKHLDCNFNLENAGLHLSQLTNLTHLSVSYSETITNADVALILNKCVNLKHLNVSSLSSMLNDTAFTLQPINAKLEHLSVSGHKKLTDRTLVSIVDNFQTTLKELIVAWNCRFTLEALYKLAEATVDAKLAYLDMTSANYPNVALAEFLAKMAILTEERCAHTLRVCCRDMYINDVELLKRLDRGKWSVRHDKRCYLEEDFVEHESSNAIQLFVYGNFEIESDTDFLDPLARDYREYGYDFSDTSSERELEFINAEDNDQERDGDENESSDHEENDPNNESQENAREAEN
jgi:hypothetical protein